MNFQTVFKRYELKYILTEAQKNKIVSAMKPFMELDKFGRTTIRNIYFDTDDFRLIRNSIEKPVFKEKLRVRSYQCANPNSSVFVELKRKYDHLVYKRRLVASEKNAMDWLCGKRPLAKATQISNEIDYFLKFYGTLKPAVFLSYEREAYRSTNDCDLRVTFDDTILCRREQLSLRSEVFGDLLLEKGKVLMEIKCSGGIPLWLTKILSEEKIYKTSFSKYGTAYQAMLAKWQEKNIKEIIINA